MRKLRVVFVIIFVVYVMLCNITYADNDFTQLSPILNNTSNIDNFNASNTSSTNNTNTNATSTNTNTTTNNLNYKVVGNEITITGVKQGITTVNIPSTIEGKTVTTIGESAFFPSNPDLTSDITSVILPDTIQYIEEGAFHDCENITEIKLSSNLKSIGSFAFSNCKSLKQIEIPCDLVNYDIFGGCRKLEKIVFSNGVKKICLDNFEGCDNLKEIHIPSSVIEIKGGLSLSMDSINNAIIYVEEGSYAQQYCQENNIKYVATNREGQQSQGQQSSEQQKQSQEKQPIQQKQTTEEQKQDPTIANTILPKTGLKYGIILIIILIAIGSGFFYKKHNYWKGVK